MPMKDSTLPGCRPYLLRITPEVRDRAEVDHPRLIAGAHGQRLPLDALLALLGRVGGGEGVAAILVKDAHARTVTSMPGLIVERS